jgi:hypothetical protein
MAKRKYEVLGLGPEFCTALNQEPGHPDRTALLRGKRKGAARMGERLPRRATRSSTARVRRSTVSPFSDLVAAMNSGVQTEE